MKKICLIFLSTICLLFLTACAQENQTNTCPNCNSTILSDSLFCPYCGCALNDSPQNNNSLSNDSSTPNNSATSTNPTQNPEEPSSPPSHIHNYSPADCTQPQICSCGATIGKPLGHSYSKTITSPTCTEQGYTTYICSCGDNYVADYTAPSHNYVNNICSKCNTPTENYRLYQDELQVLTENYEADVSALEASISQCYSNIENAQNNINGATVELASLSPTCPSNYIQDFVSKNWKQYGDTYTATKVAKEMWAREYEFKSQKLNETIVKNNAEIQTNQTNIALYISQISDLTTTYNNDAVALKCKYGIA